MAGRYYSVPARGGGGGLLRIVQGFEPVEQQNTGAPEVPSFFLVLEKQYNYSLLNSLEFSTSEADVEAALSHPRFPTTPCFLARKRHKIHGHAVINLLYSTLNQPSHPLPKTI